MENVSCRDALRSISIVLIASLAIGPIRQIGLEGSD